MDTPHVIAQSDFAPTDQQQDDERGRWLLWLVIGMIGSSLVAPLAILYTLADSL